MPPNPVIAVVVNEDNLRRMDWAVTSPANTPGSAPFRPRFVSSVRNDLIVFRLSKKLCIRVLASSVSNDDAMVTASDVTAVRSS